MKALTCEMCSGTDLIKQDGMYVCQHCGMKYSVEDAKRMMIEGTVDVQGTVKVDNSSFVEKYLLNARRAKQKEDWDEVEKYYNMVEQNDPSNIEAIFYSSYAKAKSSLTNEDIFKRQAIFKVLNNSVSILDDNFDLDREEEHMKIIAEIAQDIIKMSGSSFVYTTKRTQYGTTDNKGETYELFRSLALEFTKTLDNIVQKYAAVDKSRARALIELNITMFEYMRDHLYSTVNGKTACNENIVRLHTLIKEFDADHEIPTFDPIKRAAGTGPLAGLIAGAVLGLIILGIYFLFFR
ncbi:MAG: TFIIB-type zinc finger domain-containing protein [Clostridia bacterium]|nr:TFIIB-type zinc finger domain-containing protein [Clostridia bacterium]